MVVEGAVAARSVSELARSLGVDIPLTFAVKQSLYNGVTLDRALEILYRPRPLSRVLRTRRLAQKGYYHGFHQNRSVRPFGRHGQP